MASPACLNQLSFRISHRLASSVLSRAFSTCSFPSSVHLRFPRRPPQLESALQWHSVAAAATRGPRGSRHLSLSNLFEPDDTRTVVESYNPHGFVVNGVLMQGAVILLSNTQLVWNVRSVQDITWESLAVLQVLKQKPDLCIIGTGPRIERLSEELRKGLMLAGIGVEVMDTVNALATFNVLNEEGRVVVGAFLPVDPLEEQVKTLQESVAAKAAASTPQEGAPREPPQESR